MKRIFAFMAMSALVLNSFAQAGDIFVGGEVGFSTAGNKSKSGGNTTDGVSSYDFTFSPAAHYYLSDNFAVGFGLGYNISGSKDPDYYYGNNQVVYKYSERLLSFNPYIRFDAISVSNLKVFLKAGFGLGFGASSFKYGNLTIDGPSKFDLNFGLRPGIAYKLSDKFEITALLGGLTFDHSVSTQTTNGTDTKTITNTFGLGITTGLSFGLLYKL